MSIPNYEEQVRKQTEKLAQTIAKQEAEKNAGVVKKAASDAAKKARLETLKAEQKRLADKSEAARLKTRDAKLAHIFFRVMRKGMGDAWVFKCLDHIKATPGVMQEFACLLPQASPKAAANTDAQPGESSPIAS